MGGRGQPPLASGRHECFLCCDTYDQKGAPRGPLTVTVTYHYVDESRMMTSDDGVMFMICKSNNDYLHLQIQRVAWS